MSTKNENGLSVIRAVLVMLLVCILPYDAQGQDKSKESNGPVQKIKVSKETTWFTEPLDENGDVDFWEAANRHYSKGVTPDNNFVVAVLNVVGLKEKNEAVRQEICKRLGVSELPKMKDYLSSLSNFGKSELGREEAFELIFKVIREPWDSNDYPVAWDWIEEYSGLIDEFVDQLDNKSTLYYPFIARKPEQAFFPGHFFDGTRMICRYLRARSMNSLHRGDVQACQRDLLACRKMAYLQNRGSLLVDQLFGNAILSMTLNTEWRLLHYPRVGVLHLESYQSKVNAIEVFSQSKNNAINLDRLITLDGMIKLFKRGDHKSNPLCFYGVRIGPYRETLQINQVLESINLEYDQLIKDEQTRNGYLLSAPINQKWIDFGFDGENVDVIERQLDAVPIKQRSRMFGEFSVLALHSGAFYVWHVSSQRIKMRDELFRVCLALRLYHYDHGQYPDSLDKLGKNYIKQMPVDRFSSKPLIYKRYGEHYLLYSVGRNGIDDSGNIFDERYDYGFTSDLKLWEFNRDDP